MDSKEVSAALHLSQPAPCPQSGEQVALGTAFCAWCVLFLAFLAPVATPSCCPCRSGERTLTFQLALWCFLRTLCLVRGARLGAQALLVLVSIELLGAPGRLQNLGSSPVK